MLHDRVLVPSSYGAQIPMDVYVPNVSCEIEPDIRRPAIVICPGGAYRACCEREAEPVALRFLTEGFNVFVIWYRVHCAPGEAAKAHEAARWYSASPEHRFPMPQHDAASCVAYVRRHAEEYHTDPDRIAIMGFSAGGHLAASLAGLWHRADFWQEMNLTPEDVKPNAAVLSYPVIAADKDAHRGSFENLSNESEVEKHQSYSVLNWVTENYPPTFLWHTFADETVPVQNSIRMAHALAECGVLTELHIFPYGVHGLSLCNDITAPTSSAPLRQPNVSMRQPECECWPAMAARFLRSL